MLKNSAYSFFIFFILSIIIGINCPFFLPEKFYFDSDHIIQNFYNEKGLFKGSYGFSTLFYSITGLSRLPYSLIALIQSIAAFIIIYKIGIPNRFSQLSIKNCLIFISFILISIFIGQPSKEFITFIFIATITYIFQYKKFSLGISILLSSILFFFFSILFRPYFAFIPFISFPIYIVTKIKLKNRWLVSIIMGIVSLVFISFTYKIIKDDFLSQVARENINQIRLKANDKNANTMITTPIPITDIYTETFSIIYGFVTVNFPINGLKFFYKPQVVSFVIWQILVMWIIIVRFSHLLNDYPKHKKDLWLMCILLSYFIIQGIFEPDLGSAIRHKIGIFPLIYYLFYYDDFKRKV